MKTTSLPRPFLLPFLFSAAFALGEPAAGHAAGAGQPIRILAIGNSFSKSLCRYFPSAAEAAGERIEFCNLYIGGCSLSRHADNIRKGAEDPAFAPYDVTWFDAGKPDSPRKFKSNVPQMLATQAWDVVTIQQASHDSWDPATYRPAADQVIAEIRRLAPQAEIVIQQTWAYNAADSRIGGANPKWGFDQAGMAERVESAYRKLATDFGLRVIPVGAAVRLRREALAAAGRVFDPASLQALAPGQQPDVCGDPVGNYWWKTDAETGEKTLQRDNIHLNPAGEYLQALVWLGFFTDRNPRDIPYAPTDVRWADDIPGLRNAAALALDRAGIWTRRP